MSVEFRSQYRVAAEDVRLTVTVGDGQIGTTVVKLGGSLLKLGDIKDLVIGKGLDISGKELYIKTAVTDVNDSTNNTSVTYLLSGGTEPLEHADTATVDAEGNSIVYRAWITFTR